MAFNENEDINGIYIAQNSTEITKQNKLLNSELPKLKVYKRRWLMLAIYMICSIVSSFQWVEYMAITNIITRYYGIPPLIVEWMSMSCPIFYVVFMFPLSYLANKYGLRWILIVSSGLSWLGAFMKIFSVHSDRFHLIIISKSMTAIAQTIVVPLTGRMAALWFPSNAFSTVTSLGVLGFQLGIGCGFFFPSIIVKNHENLDDIGNDLSRLIWIIVVVSTVGFLLTLILFQDEPKLPPSETRALQKINQAKRDDKFVETIKRLLKNKNFIIYCNIYSINVSIVTTYYVLLNPIIHEYFQNAEEDVGRIGSCIPMFGLVGSVTCGIILDKTHKFKVVDATVYFFTLLCSISFAIFTVLRVKWMMYVSASLLGFFVTGHMALGYEIGIEYTYPESENISIGIMNIMLNIYNTTMITIFGILLKTCGTIPVFIGGCLIILIGFISVVLIKDEQRRQDATKKLQSERLMRIIEDTDNVTNTDAFVHNIN